MKVFIRELFDPQNLIAFKNNKLIGMRIQPQKLYL